MDDGFYQRGLESFGLQIVVPIPADRQNIQDIQVKIASGIVNEDFRTYFKDLIRKYSDVDAVVLACTELPLAVNPLDFEIPIISPSMLQCQAAFDFAICADTNN
jgi:aspartate racemase